MNPSQVENLVGKPDDVWTAADHKEYCRYKHTVWCYGSKGHLSMPTLGRVVFSDSGVEQVIGTSFPPHLNEIPELELRRVLGAMWYAPTDEWAYESGQTGAVMRAVNLLQALGRDRALAVLREFDELSQGGPSGDQWLYWVPLVLFDPPKPPGYLPIAGLGEYGPNLKDPHQLARFPVLLWQDIPFLCFDGFNILGSVEHFDRFLDRFENLKTFRADPLHPANDPFRAYEELTASSSWRSEYRGFDQKIRLDLISLAEIQIPYSPSTDFDAKKGFEKAHKVFVRAGGHWDAKQLRYVGADGSYAKPPSAIAWRTRYWEPPIGPLSVVLRVQRESSERVSIDAEVQLDEGISVAPLLLTVKNSSGTVSLATCQVTKMLSGSQSQLTDEAFYVFAGT